MSANDQVIVAPYPQNLSKYAVWHDGCVDNPFNFGQEPIGVFDTLEEAMEVAGVEANDGWIPAEYGIRFISRDRVSGYTNRIWDEFPDYEYLDVVTSSERR